MGKYFVSTDGFRGEANVELTVEHAYKVGRYLGWKITLVMKSQNCNWKKIHVEVPIC